MEIKIVEYSEQYKPELVRMMNELMDFVVATDPIARIHRMPGYGENMLKRTLENVVNQQGIIYLAMDEDKVIGFTTLIVLKQTEEDLLSRIPSETGYLDDLYVDENYRGQGVGQMLIDKGFEYFKSIGCDGVWVEVFAMNGQACGFYKKNGFMEREIGMLKKLN